MNIDFTHTSNHIFMVNLLDLDAIVSLQQQIKAFFIFETIFSHFSFIVSGRLLGK
jgi:hypothetical protein